MRDPCRRLWRPPPCACGLLPVLGGLTLLWHDGCGCAGKDLGGSRADDARRKRWRVLQGLTVGKPTRETVLTMAWLGGKVLSTIKGDEHLMGQNAPWVSQGLLLQGCTDLAKDGRARAWRHRLEARADGMVARDRRDAEEGLSVIVCLPLVERALGLHQRRRLPEQDAQGPSGSVSSRGTGLGARLAHVGEASGVLTSNRLEMIEASGPGHRRLLGLQGAPP